MSIINKLNYLNETKNLIKQSLLDNGVEISDTTSFRDYVDKINEVGNKSFNISGLSLWFDATCNTRDGFDETKTYVEPLIVTPTAVESDATYTTYYKSSTSGTWDGKLLDLGENGAFKINHALYNDPMTIECVYKFTEIPTTNDILRLWHLGGICLVVYGLGSDTNAGKFFITGPTNELPLAKTGVLYYIVFQYNTSTGISIRIEPDGIIQNYSDATFTIPSSSSYFGVGTAPATSSSFSSSTFSKGMQFGMLRCWNRLLTNEEINKNYNEIKHKFES